MGTVSLAELDRKRGDAHIGALSIVHDRILLVSVLGFVVNIVVVDAFVLLAVVIQLVRNEGVGGGEIEMWSKGLAKGLDKSIVVHVSHRR